MKKINIKALSSNEMYGGRKVKSYKYRDFERKILPLFPPLEIPEGPITLTVYVGLSSRLADLDNTLKPFIDCMQLKYGFNDKRIYKILAKKEDVAKGAEYIKFNIEGFKNDRRKKRKK